MMNMSVNTPDPAFDLADAIHDVVTAPSYDLDILRQALVQEPDLKSFEPRVRQVFNAAFDSTLWGEAIRMLRERTLTSMIMLCEEELEEIGIERADESLNNAITESTHAQRSIMTEGERAFCAMVLNKVPEDVWDACVVALDSRSEAGRRTAQEIFDRWWSAKSQR